MPALQHDDAGKLVAKEGEDGGAAVRRIVDVSRVPLTRAIAVV